MSDKYAALRQQILNPANGSRDHLRKIALQLLDELAEREADKARIAELDDALCKLLPGCEYMDPPDGGSPSLITQVQRMVEDYRQRIAELDSRKVKLPGGWAVRSGHPINEAERGVLIPKDGGQWLARFDVEHALQVAGITLETGV